jgi:hypothetical protein
MSGTNFERALLMNADFSRTNLTKARFDSAELIGSNFLQSNLQRAYLTDSSDPPDQSYAIQYSIATGKEALPTNFRCADLRGADFAGSAFFGLVEGSDDQDLRAVTADLKAANLAGTNFSQIRIYSLHRQDADGREDLVPPISSAKLDFIRSRPKESAYKLTVVAVGPWKILEPLSIRFRNSLQVLMENFESGQHLDQALLPAALNAYRGKYPPPKTNGTNSDPCK